jgi:hypothetical protein
MDPRMLWLRYVVSPRRALRAISDAIPGHGQSKDAMVIARAYGATATTAFANGHGPDGLADGERQSAACPVIDEEASHDK